MLILTVSIISLWVISIAHLLLTFALIRRLNTSKARTEMSEQTAIINLQQGDQAPDFTAQQLNGDTITLASLAGRKIALVFMGPDCQPCRQLLPELQPLYEKALEADVALMVVSTGNKAATHRFVAGVATHMRVLIAPRKANPFLNDYKVSATPAFCFITAQGIISRAGAVYLEGKTWAAFDEFLREEVQSLEATEVM